MKNIEDIKKAKKITPAEAGAILGLNQETVRIGLQQHAFDFGTAIKHKSGRWSYHIAPIAFYNYLTGTKT